MSDLTDRQLRQAWRHLSTDRIKAMPLETGADRERVNAARKRIIALRDQDEKDTTI